MKTVKIILGILSLVVAIIFFMDPIPSQVIYLYITSIYFGAVGIVYLIDYCVNKQERKNAGMQVTASTVGIALSVAAILFMLLNMTVPGFPYATQYLVAVILIISLLVEGIVTVVSALTFIEFLPVLRAMAIIFGILMIVVAYVAFGYIPVIIGMLGIFTGIGIAVSGVSLIISACSEKHIYIEEIDESDDSNNAE